MIFGNGQNLRETLNQVNAVEQGSATGFQSDFEQYDS